MPPRILIADGELYLEAQSLGSGEYELRKAASASEMISALAKEKPEAVVVDYATASTASISKEKTLLEWMQGYYSAKFLVTADADKRAEAAALCAKAKVSLQIKPLGAAELFAVVGQVLKGRLVGAASVAAAGVAAKGAPAASAAAASSAPAFAAPAAPADAKETEVLRKVEDFIYNLTGIRVPKTHNLASTVRKRMDTLGFEDAAHYFGRLTTSREEAQTLIEEVTINETYFFRNTSHFDCLRDHLFPEIIRRGQQEGRKEVVMWSAACSTGEEPYSLAILAKQIFPKEWTIRIHASDIDSKVIRFAQNGVYPHTRIARTPPAYMGFVTRFLRGTDDGWGFDGEIKGLVSFRRESIFEAGLKNLDFIFCRNVMIYFDQAGIAKMADIFNASLRDDGVVIIGHSEFLRTKPSTLHYTRVSNVSLYRKREEMRKAA